MPRKKFFLPPQSQNRSYGLVAEDKNQLLTMATFFLTLMGKNLDKYIPVVIFCAWFWQAPGTAEVGSGGASTWGVDDVMDITDQVNKALSRVKPETIGESTRYTKCP